MKANVGMLFWFPTLLETATAAPDELSAVIPPSNIEKFWATESAVCVPYMARQYGLINLALRAKRFTQKGSYQGIIHLRTLKGGNDDRLETQRRMDTVVRFGDGE